MASRCGNSSQQGGERLVERRHTDPLSHYNTDLFTLQLSNDTM